MLDDRLTHWDAVEACRHASQLVFIADDVFDRINDHGYLLPAQLTRDAVW
ncbi:hypothetical protein [Amycolatopsis sp. lyj-346]